MDELKPCPFCGGKAEITHQRWNKRDHYGVLCTGDCGVFLDERADTREEAATAWNRRFAEHPLVQMTRLDEELGLLDSDGEVPPPLTPKKDTTKIERDAQSA